MREIRLYGSEGGGAAALPTPILFVHFSKGDAALAPKSSGRIVSNLLQDPHNYYRSALRDLSLLGAIASQVNLANRRPETKEAERCSLSHSSSLGDL